MAKDSKGSGAPAIASSKPGTAASDQQQPKKKSGRVTIADPPAPAGSSTADHDGDSRNHSISSASGRPSAATGLANGGGAGVHRQAQSENASYLNIDPQLLQRSGLSESELHELVEIFSLVDVDHGGTISTDELETLMQTVGLKASQEELETIVNELDAEGTGEIDFESFVIGMSRTVQTDITAEMLARAFHAFEAYPQGDEDTRPAAAASTSSVGVTQGSGGNGGSGGGIGSGIGAGSVNGNDSRPASGDMSVNGNGNSSVAGSGATAHGADNATTSHDGVLPYALILKILSGYGDPDKRMTRREAEEIIKSVGPAGPKDSFNYRQFISMYINDHH